MLSPPQHANGPLSQAFASFSDKARAVGHRGDGLSSLLRNAQTSKDGLPVLTLANPKPAAQKPSPKADYGPAQINAVGRALRTIYACPAGQQPDVGPSTSLQSLYLAVEGTVVLATQGQDLYERVKMELERAVGEVARSLSAGASDGDEPSWLRRLDEAWVSWCDKTSLVCRILTVLDRVYVLDQPHLLSVWQLALDLFKHAIVQDDVLKERALASVVLAVNRHRQSASAYRDMHLSLLSMLATLDSYRDVQQRLLASTKSFYQEESHRLIAQLSTNEYLAHAERRIDEETQATAWLYQADSERVEHMRAVRRELVSTHVDALVAGLPDLLTAAETASLRQLYDLLAAVGALTPLRTAFGSFICLDGERIVQDREHDDRMIERLLDYKAKVDGIVADAFKADGDLRQTQKEAFETFINKRENKPAELIAKFLDIRLRSGNKTMSDDELEHVLDEALILFRYTHAKDMFEEFYKRYFAKRLLLNRSASSDAEQSMLLKLKEECGAAFTQKLETMLKDVSLSDDMMKAYDGQLAKEQAAVTAAAAAEDGGEAFDLHVNVLTQAHWPTYPQVDVIIPPEMAASAERFRAFYEARFQGRKLHWAHSLGTTALMAQFGRAGEKELHLSTFQTVVLLLFNGLEPGARLGYAAIRARTGLEDKELKRTLQSLACGQIPTRVLRKEPQGKDVDETDAFTVNEGIKNDRKRIRVNMIQLAETQEEQKSTVDRVMFDRELVLQASAVRILKAKKTVKHAELLQDIVAQIAARFTVDVAEIKKTFETLIDKEYMERVEGQRGVYRYLA